MHTMYDFVKEREQAMFEEGEIVGRAEGEKIGEKRGRLEGENANKIAVALKLLSMGMDITMISEATGLTEDEIKKLISRECADAQNIRHNDRQDAHRQTAGFCIYRYRQP